MRGWRANEIKYHKHETVIRAELLTEMPHCKCKKCKAACRSTNLEPHGWSSIQSLQHTPSDDRPRRIEYRRKRYLCLDCGHTSQQPVAGRYKHTRMTRQLRRYIARQALLPDESFSGIAKRVGQSEKNVRKIFEQHRLHLKSIRKIETPRIAGMDGVYVRGRESLIVTDLELKRPVMMRPCIKERAIADAIREMPTLHKVKGVVSDLAGTLDRVQQEVLPKAKRIKDRYHVQRMANAALDFVRRALTPGKNKRRKGQMGMVSAHLLRKRKQKLKDKERPSLDWCLALYPLLRLTYELKEAFCEIWRSKDGVTARQKYVEWLEMHAAWVQQMPEDLRGAFDQLIRVMSKWEEGIFNYFSDRHTNGYTESANAGVKRLTCRAPNAKFDTIETKIVQGSRLLRQRKAVWERGKARRAKHPRQPPPVTSGVDTDLGGQENQPSELVMSIVPPNPMTDVKVSGPRLEVNRILTLKRNKEEKDGDAKCLSSQIRLFD